MAEELCSDVRNLIIQKMEKSEDMTLIVIHDGEPYDVMFYVSRNMRDPPHHVRFTSYHNCTKTETSYLLRTEKALRKMLELELHQIVVDVTIIYVQGDTKPISLYLDWRMKEDPKDFKSDMHTYVVSHMSSFYSIDDDDTDDPEWKHPSYLEDIHDLILTLVSLG